MSRLVRKLTLVPLGVLLALLIVEGVLQVLGLFESGRAEATELREGERRILCVGDSNTYGIHLQSHESYPGQLQILLDQARPGSFRVINVGWPGRNSAEVRALLREQLERFKPEICIVWIGINDTWSRAMSGLWDQDHEEVTANGSNWLEWSKTIRLARLLVQRLHQEQISLVVGADGRSQLDGFVPKAPEDFAFAVASELDHHIRLDVSRICRICEEHGVHILLCNYPLRDLSMINDPIQAIAGELGVPLVDLQARFLPLFDAFPYERIMFKDAHPKAIGYHEIARRVLQELVHCDWIDPDPRWSEIPPIEALLSGLDLVREGESLNPLRLALHAPEGREVNLRTWIRIERSGERVTRCMEVREPEKLGMKAMSSGLYRRSVPGGGELRFEVQMPAPNLMSKVMDQGTRQRWSEVGFTVSVEPQSAEDPPLESNMVSVSREEIERAAQAR